MRLGTLLLLVSLLGCAPLVPPVGFDELHRIIGDTDDKRFAVAGKHLQQAKLAIDGRDSHSAHRHVELGLIEVQIAQSLIAKQLLFEQIEIESKKTQKLEHDVEVWRSKVDALLQKQALDTLRTHIEAVIDKEIRVAIAHDELHSNPNDKDSDALSVVHQQYGRELIAMATLRLEIAKLYMSKDLLLQENVISLGYLLDLLVGAHQEREIAQMYEYTFQSIEQFRLRRDDVWLLHGKNNLLGASHELEKELSARGVRFDVDGMGCVINLDVDNKSLSNDAMAQIEQIATYARMNASFHIMVVATGRRGAPVVAYQQATMLVGQFTKQFKLLEVDASRYSEMIFSGERPLDILAGKSPKLALLLFPLP